MKRFVGSWTSLLVGRVAGRRGVVHNSIGQWWRKNSELVVSFMMLMLMLMVVLTFFVTWRYCPRSNPGSAGVGAGHPRGTSRRSESAHVQNYAEAQGDSLCASWTMFFVVATGDVYCVLFVNYAVLTVLVSNIVPRPKVTGVGLAILWSVCAIFVDIVDLFVWIKVSVFSVEYDFLTVLMSNIVPELKVARLGWIPLE